MDEAPETPVGPRGPDPVPNPVSAARSTNPFDPTEEEEDAIDPETKDESLKEQLQACGYPTGRDFKQDILTHVCTQVLQVGIEFQVWLQAEGITNLPTLLTYDLEDYRASGFDISWPLYKMICALAHWCLYHPSAITDDEGRVFFLTRRDLQRYMVTMMRPKAADELSQAASSAENFSNPADGTENFTDLADGPNNFIDSAINPADDSAGTTVPDDITAPTETTVPGDVTDDVSRHVTTRIPGLTLPAHSKAAHMSFKSNDVHAASLLVPA